MRPAGKISFSVAENLTCSLDAVLAYAREKYVVIFGSHCCSTWQEVDDPKICGRQSPPPCLQTAVRHQYIWNRAVNIPTNLNKSGAPVQHPVERAVSSWRVVVSRPSSKMEERQRPPLLIRYIRIHPPYLGTVSLVLNLKARLSVVR
jgi:hypothetical protein